ncbi:MAG: protein-tyrosine-phosphatase [Bacteroidetes bacterium]|nr:protein-tyrosine-phosphatase [Bacteroidota bacterium]
MNPELHQYMQSLPNEWQALSPERKAQLEELAAFINEQKQQLPVVQLTFICTHNSRRSHIGQLWAAAAAAHVGLEGIVTYSGGTEATAFNPRAVAAMQRAGFAIENPGGDNPRYQVRLSTQAAPLTCFSKKYDDAANPQKGFIAVMVCSDADAACPFVPGASGRFAIPYLDPKASDGTPQEAETYDLRSRQMAAEMLYVMTVAKKLSGE